jgi:hypothetical protein
MTDLHETASLCAKIADDHGFDVCTWENFPTKIMFVVSEIHETRDEMYRPYREHKVDEEMADIAIRTMVILETLWPGWSTGRITQRRLDTKSVFEKAESLLWPMISYAVKALHHWRNEERTDAGQCLELLLLELWRIADRLKIDLDGSIQLKMDVNEQRPMRNGKKRSEG